MIAGAEARLREVRIPIDDQPAATVAALRRKRRRLDVECEQEGAGGFSIRREYGLGFPDVKGANPPTT